MKINREDVVQAALTVERWCKEHFKSCGVCDCPFSFGSKCMLARQGNLSEFLRTRGLKNGSV